MRRTTADQLRQRWLLSAVLSPKPSDEIRSNSPLPPNDGVEFVGQYPSPITCRASEASTKQPKRERERSARRGKDSLDRLRRPHASANICFLCRAAIISLRVQPRRFSVSCHGVCLPLRGILASVLRCSLVVVSLTTMMVMLLRVLFGFACVVEDGVSVDLR